MSEWIDFSQWVECKSMERPGYVFEVVNAEQLSMLTPCIVPLEIPFDWSSSPVKFRMVLEGRPQHSAPLPSAEDGPSS